MSSVRLSEQDINFMLLVYFLKNGWHIPAKELSTKSNLVPPTGGVCRLPPEALETLVQCGIVQYECLRNSNAQEAPSVVGDELTSSELCVAVESKVRRLLGIPVLPESLHVELKPPTNGNH